MATPVACCGGECGIIGANLSISGIHWELVTAVNNWSVSTTTIRSGLRSFRYNPSASQSRISGWLAGTAAFSISSPNRVWREYIRFASLPDADCILGWFDYSGSQAGFGFQASDSTIRSVCVIAGVKTFGFTGVIVTTGVWYRIDIKTVGDVVTGTSDVQVDGTACGQATGAFVSANGSRSPLRGSLENISADIFYEDFIGSITLADYPLGAGYILSYIPNADGTHNVAGANDFERTLTGTDILNTTTDANVLVAQRPLVTPITTWINMVAPPNATDYVEVQFEDSVEAAPPRTVEVIAAINQAGTGNGNMEIRLNDNGTMGIVYTATGVAGVTVATGAQFKRAHFADPPSAASVWVLGGAGDGDFNNLKVRFGSPAALDVNPDQYFGSIMLEAEYAEIFNATRKPVNINQAVQRLSLR